MAVQQIRWMHYNWENIMEALAMAKSFNTNEVYVKSPVDKKVHKLYIKYLNPFTSTNGNIFEISINDVEMGNRIRDFGDAYDCIKDYLGPEE